MTKNWEAIINQNIFEKKTLRDQLDLFEQIQQLVKQIPNDQELGTKIREIINGERKTL